MQHPRKPISTIGLDADDTLWQSEHFFKLTEGQFVDLLSGFAEKDHLRERLFEAEKKNLEFYGFGIKGFTLSMVETAIEVTGGKVPASVIENILSAGREMLRHPIIPLPDVRETLEQLSTSFDLVLITKGDLFDQERKLAQSGLGKLFKAVEIVSDKSAQTYQRIFDRHGEGPARAVMVGNSLKSDIVPALDAGSWGIFIPHALTWAHEHTDAPASHPRFRQADRFPEIIDLIKRMD